ncbi:DNA recombination protein RmuC [bacterium]|nr:DNA recombination protein RmuC [bacterium]
MDRLLEAVNRIREETKTVIDEKTGELHRLSAEENRQARKEVNESLDQFRKTLNDFRETLAAEQGKGRKESRESLESVTQSLTQRFEKLQESNEKRLEQIRGEVEKKLSETLQKSDESYKGMIERLGELGTTNQRIMQFSKELTQLQSILQAPKLRGIFGELGMESMLNDCLAPNQFATQYSLSGGVVDAVIFNPHGTLPIDSKFPLEAWQRMHDPEADETEQKRARTEFVRAVKKHISDIAAKYIKPPETLDFAVMYLRAEGVYYELLEIPELMEHARACRVFPASPLTFWALLQVTVMGFRGLQISENAKRIASLLDGMQGDMEQFRRSFETATKQVRHAGQNLEDAGKQLDKVDSKLTSIRSTQIENSTESLNNDPLSVHERLIDE